MELTSNERTTIPLSTRAARAVRSLLGKQEAGIIINNGEFDHELKVRRDGRNEQSSQRCTWP